VRFVDLLRVTVLLSAGAATALGVVCVLGASAVGDAGPVLVSAGWWVVAMVIGGVVGRRAQTNPPVARALAQARAATTLPEHRPGPVVLNRLWPLLLSTVLAGAVAFLVPQVPGIAAGFAIIWALAWRRQDAAVLAVEERDGVTFYVERTSPVRAIQLLRTPGFRREVPTLSTSG
jgi:hypothetical protein